MARRRVWQFRCGRIRVGWTAAALAATALAVPASGATTTASATWTFGGAPTAYTGTMTLPALGFPAATLASDSGNFANLGVQAGGSMWFGPTTPPGQVFGSSQNQPYLSLRTRSDAGAGTPSTTTYTFAAATPRGWGFVLGDVDADRVRVTGTTAAGAPLSATDFGFQSGFNMCATSPKPSGCGTNDVDVPAWDPATSTLVGNGADTNGAAGWFRPGVPVRTLTFTFTRVSGAPTFQTWFAVRRQDITGTVSTAAGCDPSQARLTLLGPDGSTLVTTAPDAAGRYAFTGVSAGAGYLVRLDAVPAGCVASGASVTPVDLTAADAVADFTVVGPVTATAAVHGSVTDVDHQPIRHAVLTLRSDDAVVGRATTDAAGDYRLPAVPAGHYTLALDPPGDLVVVGRNPRPVAVHTDQPPRVDFAVRRPAHHAVAPTPAVTTTAVTTTAVTTAALPEVGGPVRWWTPVVGVLLLAAGGVSWRRRRRPAGPA